MGNAFYCAHLETLRLRFFGCVRLAVSASCLVPVGMKDTVCVRGSFCTDDLSASN